MESASLSIVAFITDSPVGLLQRGAPALPQTKADC